MNCDDIYFLKSHFVIRYLKEPGLFLYFVKCSSDGVKFTDNLYNAMIYRTKDFALCILNKYKDVLPDNCEVLSVYDADEGR